MKGNGTDRELPFGGVCPACEDEYVTAMTEQPPDEQVGPYQKARFSPKHPVKLCVREGWLFIHEPNVEVAELANWEAYLNLSKEDDYAFVNRLVDTDISPGNWGGEE